MAGKKKTGGGETDADLWRQVAESVRPLKSRPASIRSIDSLYADRAEEFPRKQVSTKGKSPRAAPPPVQPPPGKPAPALSVGASPGVDKRTADRLRRGKLAIEARLDLHGHTQESAHRALYAFIDGAYATGRRCVLVVTGKGKGVLQTGVPRWLNEAPMRQKILSIQQAQQKDGGTGALYVLLRRQR